MENFENTIRKIWEKAKICSEETKDEWRKDSYNEWIRWKDYGNTHSDFGWVIDIIRSEDGGEISNLRPMQWKNEFKILLQNYMSNKNSVSNNAIPLPQLKLPDIMKNTLLTAAAIISKFGIKGQNT